MAKEVLNPMGLDSAELNALMAVQVQKLGTTLQGLKTLLEQNNCLDFSSAYQLKATEDFIEKRDARIEELRKIVDVMERLRVVQLSVGHKGDQ
jgi:hypothetical protein